MCHNTTVQNVSWQMHQPPPCCECATREHITRQPSCFCHTLLYTSSIEYLKVRIIISLTKMSVNQLLLFLFTKLSYVYSMCSILTTIFLSIHVKTMCTHQLYSLVFCVECGTSHYLLFKYTWCGQFLFTVRKTKFAVTLLNSDCITQLLVLLQVTQHANYYVDGYYIATWYVY